MEWIMEEPPRSWSDRAGKLRRLSPGSFRMLSLILSIVSIFCFIQACGKKPVEKFPSFEQITEKDGLSSGMVYAIAVQGEEVWFGTYGGGANLYDPAKKTWKAYTTKGEPLEQIDDGDSVKWKNILSYNHVSVILPDRDRIWFGTYFYGFGGGGISYYDPQKNPPWKPFNTNGGRAKKVVSMALDGESLWVGSEKGLNLFDKRTEEWKEFYSTQNGLSGNFVNTILVQPDFLWIGTNGGVTRLQKDRKAWKTYSEKDGLTETEVKSLVEAGPRILAGGIGGTLFEYDSAADSWRRIESADPLRNGGIHSIAVTNEKAFICRDNGVSIYHFSSGQWESLTTSEGLLSNTVFCAAVDVDKDSVWFGTDKGVSRLVLSPE